jgi:hypothetical protein
MIGAPGGPFDAAKKSFASPRIPEFLVFYALRLSLRGAHDPVPQWVLTGNLSQLYCSACRSGSETGPSG